MSSSIRRRRQTRLPESDPSQTLIVDWTCLLVDRDDSLTLSGDAFPFREQTSACPLAHDVPILPFEDSKSSDNSDCCLLHDFTPSPRKHLISLDWTFDLVRRQICLHVESIEASPAWEHSVLIREGNRWAIHYGE